MRKLSRRSKGGLSILLTVVMLASYLEAALCLSTQAAAGDTPEEVTEAELEAVSTPGNFDSASAVNYATILGRATDFGIVAERFLHQNHMETTYAINYLSQINSQVTDVDFIKGTAQFIVGHVSEGQISLGSAQTANTYNMEISSDVVGSFTYPWYNNNNAQYTGIKDNFRIDYNFGAHDDQDLVIKSVTTKTAEDNIQRIISNAKERSTAINAKANDASYAIDPDAYRQTTNESDKYVLNLDRDEFENKVVYINVSSASQIRSYLEGSDTLKIKKRSSTVIAFNIDNSISDITLNQILVSVDGGNYWIRSTTGSGGTETNNNDNTNDEVDAEICQKIIWNVMNESAKVKINNTAGTFLITGAESDVDVTGSSAGWAVAGGDMTNHAEWHYIYKGGSQETMKDGKGEIHFAARKSFTEAYNGKTTQEDTSVYSLPGEYSFHWYKTDQSYNISGLSPVATVTNQATNTIKFPTLTFTAVEVNNPASYGEYEIPNGSSRTYYYKITEKGAGSNFTNSEGRSVELSTGYINIKLTVQNDNGTLNYVVDSQTVLGNGVSYKTNENVNMSGVEFSLGAFFNRLTTTSSATANVSIEKLDASTKNALSGAKLQLKADNNMSFTDANVSLGADAGNLSISGSTVQFVSGQQRTSFLYLTPGSYTLSELAAPSGYQLSSEKIKFTVNNDGSVVNGNGSTLEKAGTYYLVSMTNEETAESGTSKATITVNKAWSVPAGYKNPSTSGYRFRLVSTDGKDTTEYPIQSSNTSGKASFTMNYSKSGTYKYKLTEIDDGAAGVTYDATEHEVTVEVKSNTNKTLISPATVTIDGKSTGSVTFTNAYKAEETSVDIAVTKALSNGTLADGQFSFLLTPSPAGAAYPLPEGASNGQLVVKNDASGNVSFGSITYTAPGTYKYTITETDKTDTNVTYDSGLSTVTVTVSDDGKGGLKTAVKYSKTKFTNKYKNTTFDIAAKKYVDNGESSAHLANSSKGEVYSFKLSFNNKEYIVSNDKSGNISFKSLEMPGDGSYPFTITELPDTDAPEGLVYAADLTGTVTIAAGNAAVSFDGGQNTMTNTIKKVRFDAAFKKLDDKGGQLADAVFSLSKTGNDLDFTDSLIMVLNGAETASTERTATALRFTSSGSQTTTFRNLTPGSYTLHEDAAPVGYKKAADITFTIGEDGNVSSTALTDGVLQMVDEEKHMKNTVSVTLNATKGLIIDTPGAVNPGLTPAGYSFVLTSKTNPAETYEAQSSAGGQISFPALSFSELGSFAYTLREQPGTNGGITYDTSVYDITIETLDENDDELIDANPKVTIKMAGAEVSSASFVNHYKADSVETELTAAKYMDGVPAEEGAFAFRLTPKGSSTGSVVRNDKDGLVRFGLSYNQAGTYEYTLSEVDEGKQGIKYDSHTVNVKVVVTDNKEGKLVAALSTTPAAATALAFYNSSNLHEIKIDKVDEAGKNLSGATLKLSKVGADLDFSDEKISVSGATGTATSKTALSFSTTGSTVTVKGLPAGKYILSESFAPESYQKADDIVFTIAENGSISGATLKAGAIRMVDKSGDTEASGEVSIDMQVKKNVVDDTGSAPASALNKAAYSVSLKATSDNAKAYEQSSVSFNDAGQLSMQLGTFTEPGTYTFALTEEEGDRGGISYDRTIYDVVVQVLSDGTGGLKEPVLSITKREDGSSVTQPVFENHYRAMPVDIELMGKKIFEGDGATLSSGKFEFMLELEADPANHITSETILQSNSSGDVVFKLRFDKPGTYKYKMTEIAGSRKDITYDSTSYAVTVEVQDGGNGFLEAFISGTPKDGIVFTNTYEKDENAVYFELDAKKQLSGDLDNSSLHAGDFSFSLKLQGDDETYKATNEAGGAIRFTDIPAPAEPGDYKFTITEADTPKQDDSDFGGKWVFGSGLSGIVRIAEGKDPQVIFDQGQDTITNSFTYTLGRFNLQVDKKIEKIEGDSLAGAKLRFTRDDSLFDFTDSRTLVTQGLDTAKDLVKTKDSITFTTTSVLTVITGIPSGDYTLVEIEAPEGYQKADPIHFTVDANGNVSSSRSTESIKGATVVMIDDPWPVEGTPTPKPTKKPSKSGKEPTPTPYGWTGYEPTPTPYGWTGYEPTPTPYGWQPTPTPYGWDGSPTPITRGGRVITRAGDDASPKTGDRTNPAGIFAAVGLLSMLGLVVLKLLDRKSEEEE